jgi:hypothetical protein
MKEMYNQAPDEWIVLWAIPIGWMNHGKWVKSINPAFNEENYYKLIHIKHKRVLEAYLADNSVGIETLVSRYYGTGLYASFYREWKSVSDFIEHYEPYLDYRLEDKEDDGFKNWAKNR